MYINSKLVVAYDIIVKQTFDQQVNASILFFILFYFEEERFYFRHSPPYKSTKHYFT